MFFVGLNRISQYSVLILFYVKTGKGSKRFAFFFKKDILETMIQIITKALENPYC